MNFKAEDLHAVDQADHDQLAEISDLEIRLSRVKAELERRIRARGTKSIVMGATFGTCTRSPT
jgi:hypothetical protein